MTYGERLKAAMRSASERRILGPREREWRQELRQLMAERSGVAVTVQGIGYAINSTKGAFKAEKNAAAAAALQVNPDWLAMEVGQMLPNDISPHREKIPPSGVGTPGATGYTTDVNPNTSTGGHGQIWHLPLIPMDRIELAREPNMTAVIEDLPKYPAAYGGAPYDTEQDKVLILEMDVDGTTAKRGHVAIFRPVNGRRIKQTNRPVLVKNERGDHVLMSYGAFAGMHGAELVAVCIHNYEPMDESPFV